jgi:hypothetical protein
MRYMSELFNAVGLTSVHNAGTSPEHILAYEDCRKHGELTHRAYMMIRSTEAYNGLKAANIYTGFGDEWIRVGGFKFVADGSASERTMRMSTPYVGTTDYGILTMTQEQLLRGDRRRHSHQFQVGVHANGDVTIDMVLKAYERALQKWPDPNRRHRIEHCTLINPDIIRRMKANGVIPTPFWTYVYYHGEKWKEYGDEKISRMFAHRTFLDAGIPVPGASDYTPGPFEPLMAIQSMVTRTDYKGRVWGPNQKVTVDEALTIATINGAYALLKSSSRGRSPAGKLADFVVLEQDPHDVSPDAIMNIKVNRTVGRRQDRLSEAAILMRACIRGSATQIDGTRVELDAQGSASSWIWGWRRRLRVAGVDQLDDRKRVTRGPFGITAFLVDPSVRDASAILVEADGASALYVGDLRAGILDKLLLAPPPHVDLLLMEGRTIGSATNADGFPTETDFEDQFAAIFRQTKGCRSSGARRRTSIASSPSIGRACGRIGSSSWTAPPPTCCARRSCRCRCRARCGKGFACSHRQPSGVKADGARRRRHVMERGLPRSRPAVSPRPPASRSCCFDPG